MPPIAHRTWTLIRSALPKAVGAWRLQSLWTRLLIVAVIAYGVGFSILTSLRVFALSATAYDLGVYHQSIYTTVVDHRFFYYTADLAANPTGSIFGAHFTPILILMTIPYALVPSLFTLTVIQTWALAGAAVPIYLLGRRHLSERLAFVLAAAYLLHPATQGVNWYDFHPQAFLPLALLSGLYCFERRAWTPFVLWMVIALSTIEMAAFLVAAVAVGFLASEWWATRGAGRGLDRKMLFVLIGTLLLSAAWVVVGRAVVLAVNPQNVYYGGGSGYWTVLGAEGLLDVPIRMLTSPGAAIAALAFDAPYKLWYLGILFVPVLFLPFRSGLALVCCAPWMAVSLFSNQPAFYLVGDQYPAFVLPFIFYGAVRGMAKPWKLPASVGALLFRRRLAIPSRSPGTNKLTSVAIPAATLFVLLVVSPLGPIGVGVYFVGGFPAVGYHENAVHFLYGLIPRSASVLTQSNLFPLVSDRSNAFTVPDSFYPPGTSFNTTIVQLMNTVDYLLADFQSRPVEAAILFAWANRSKAFGVVGAGDGAVLLGRNQSGAIESIPFLRSFSDSHAQAKNGSHVEDSQADGGLALRISVTTVSDFWFGPFVYLTPGVYEIAYRLRVDNPGPGRIAQLPVVIHQLGLVGTILTYPGGGARTGFDLRPTGDKVTIDSVDLRERDVPSSGRYFWFNRTFVTTGLGAVEFPGLGVSGDMGVWFDGVRIVQLIPYGWSDVSISWKMRS